MIAVLGRALRSLHAGIERTASRDPRLRTTASCSLSSTAFADGTPIPLRYVAYGAGGNVSPPLA